MIKLKLFLAQIKKKLRVLLIKYLCDKRIHWLLDPKRFLFRLAEPTTSKFSGVHRAWLTDIKEGRVPESARTSCQPGAHPGAADEHIRQRAAR